MHRHYVTDPMSEESTGEGRDERDEARGRVHLVYSYSSVAASFGGVASMQTPFSHATRPSLHALPPGRVMSGHGGGTPPQVAARANAAVYFASATCAMAVLGHSPPPQHPT